MSQVIRQGFSTMYEIIEVGSIKPGGSGKMDNGRPYSASVKFRSQNVVERMDDRVGVQEVETNIEFKVVCDDEGDCSELRVSIR